MNLSGALLSCLLFSSASAFVLNAPKALLCGTVGDAAGKPAPGVTVELRASAAAPATTLTTDAAGDYLIQSVAAGSYVVSFFAEGFKKSVRSNVRISDGQELRVDMQMAAALPGEAVDPRQSASVAYDKSKTTLVGATRTVTAHGPQRVSPCGPVR